MALADITTTGWILALLKRDDDQTLLLGSGAYDFKESQQHFTPNTYANDVIELQGTDGQLLTGQVRRSTAQSFDGYVGEAGMTRAEIEQYRRQFLMFFRRGHKYTVVYIFPDGTAIKRDRGYIVDAPSVPELYQILPEYHVALAFEDVNYYSYAEDSSGNETFAFNAHLNLSDVQGGGLEWDANGAISDALVVVYGKNMFKTPQSIKDNGVTFTLNANGTFDIKGLASAQANAKVFEEDLSLYDDGETYTLSATGNLDNAKVYVELYNGTTWKRHVLGSNAVLTSSTPTITNTINLSGGNRMRFVLRVESGKSANVTSLGIQLEKGQKTAFEPYSPAMSGGYQWAAASGGGPTFITVTGIDDAQPVWKVVGPATNPTLTNSTSGVSITWNGTVPNNQTLIVDMGAQTARLEGANVFAFISGSWLTLEPGTNRIAYTAGNTTNGCDIYWNEIVG